MDSIAAASDAIRRGRLGAVELVMRAIEQHARHGHETNAFIAFMPEQALAEARACDEEGARQCWRGALHGIPISVKDLVDVEGIPTTAGSRVLPAEPAPRDAEVIRRLRQAGAIILGKTNLHEFAFGTTNEDSAFGPVRNPLDLQRMSGGSSGGSAAAVAAGIGFGSVGTDTGGSIRIPAALCGLVGLKPTYGEVPVDGVVPLCPSFDHVGPLAHSVDDARIMWRAMSGAEQVWSAPRHVRGLRLGMPRDYFFDLLEEDVRAAWDAAAHALTLRGAKIQPVSIPHASRTPEAYVPMVFRESWAWHCRFIETVPERYTTPVRTRLEMGRAVGPEEYAAAVATRDLLAGEVEQALAEVDALVLPTMAVTAPRLGTSEIGFGDRTEPVRAVMLRLTQLFNVTGHPAVTLPMKTAGLLPAGLQLAGRRGKTADLLAMAEAVERAL